MYFKRTFYRRNLNDEKVDSELEKQFTLDEAKPTANDSLTFLNERQANRKGERLTRIHELTISLLLSSYCHLLWRAFTDKIAPVCKRNISRSESKRTASRQIEMSVHFTHR